MRESREQIEVRSLVSLLRIIACTSAGQKERERTRDRRRVRAPSRSDAIVVPAALPVYHRSVCVSCCHSNCQHINTRGRSEETERTMHKKRKKKKLKTGRSEPSKSQPKTGGRFEAEGRLRWLGLNVVCEAGSRVDEGKQRPEAHLGQSPGTPGETS